LTTASDGVVPEPSRMLVTLKYFSSIVTFTGAGAATIGEEAS
jgi:hypothetical protein